MIEQSDKSEESEEDGQFVPGQRYASLATSRLILRQPEAADAAAIVPLADNMRVAQQTRRMPHPYTSRDAESWIARANDPAGPREAVFLVTLKQRGTVLGAAGFAPMNEDDIEIGYWIGEPHWGRGFATEAAQAVIDYGFESLALERIYGRCRSSNAASRNVLVKCGFQYAGSDMCGCAALNSTVPSDEFALERSVWQSLKRWGAG